MEGSDGDVPAQQPDPSDVEQPSMPDQEPWMSSYDSLEAVTASGNRGQFEFVWTRHSSSYAPNREPEFTDGVATFMTTVSYDHVAQTWRGSRNQIEAPWPDFLQRAVAVVEETPAE